MMARRASSRDRELGHTDTEFWADHVFEEETDYVLRVFFVDGFSGGFVEVGKGFHEVHVHVEGFAVAAVDAGHFGLPIEFHKLVEAAAFFRGEGGEAFISFDGHFEAAGIAGGHGVFTEGVDGEGLARR